MQVSVTFKNLEPSEDLKSYVTEKLNRFDKLLDNPAEANVILSIEKFRHIVEINLTADKFNINGKEEQNDLYSAIDIVIDKLKNQIKKNKQKTRDRRAASKKKTPVFENIESGDKEDKHPKLVTIKDIDYKPMDIEEALMQMDLAQKDKFLVFANSKTDQINVLYRKEDGNYGLIQPSGK
ncbi:MAG: ribosome-associated translation inhibitor RaiA [Desulfobacterales bacterium]|nr:ribosome-associated translation inhibitor RaiA [Desulfobacterales bacterium]MBF0398146.1 ribosome-associated translation inhibitor RaiA [Desulfobacterales bacterium]